MTQTTFRRAMTFAALLSVAGCAAAAMTVNPETDFTLAPRGEWALLAGTKISVRVDTIAEDSRCPADVQCVQAGNAEVRIRMKTGSEGEALLHLNTNQEPKTTSFAGRTVTLLGLDPLPRQGQPVRQEDYRVRLRFEAQ